MGAHSNKIGPGRDSNSVSKGTGHGPMFGNPREALHFGLFPDGGGYPLGFMEWALGEFERESDREVDYNRVLHLCSGSVKTGVRVDIRPEVNPDIVADCRSVPLPDGSVDFIMADPPYSEAYAEQLYGTREHYPKPGQILGEASRLLKPGGYAGILHHQVPVFRKPLKLVRVYAVHRGLGFGLVAWSLLRKASS